MKAAFAIVLLTLLTAGCATPTPSHDERPHDRDRPPPALPSLFISPSGQPFRASAGEPYPVAKWFAQADKDGDGRLDRAEFRADAEAFFRALDENHDGVIDGFEVSDYEQKVAPEIAGAYGDNSGWGGRRGGRRPAPGGESGASSAAVLQGAAVFGLLDEPEPVTAADLDLSGRITLSEFLTITDRRFDLLDTKHLGYLTLADLPKTPAQLLASPGKHERKPSEDQPSDR
jgi:hypothetical protein